MYPWRIWWPTVVHLHCSKLTPSLPTTFIQIVLSLPTPALKSPSSRVLWSHVGCLRGRHQELSGTSHSSRCSTRRSSHRSSHCLAQPWEMEHMLILLWLFDCPSNSTAGSSDSLSSVGSCSRILTSLFLIKFLTPYSFFPLQALLSRKKCTHHLIRWLSWLGTLCSVKESLWITSDYPELIRDLSGCATRLYSILGVSTHHY